MSQEKKQCEWVRLSELAGLPGLPGSKRGCEKKAHREGWRSRPRQGRGGGREYFIADLPAPTREALAKEEPPTIHSAIQKNCFCHAIAAWLRRLADKLDGGRA